VIGLVEADPSARGQAERQEAFRGLPWMTEEQLLATPGLEAVLVETHVRDLLATAEKSVAAGKHVHIDKPPGNALSHLRRILDAAAKQNLLVQMGYMYRYNPAIVMLRDLLGRGWLGEPFEVHAVMSKVVPPDSRRQLAEYPGGIMFELGCHVVDLVVGVLGPPTRVTPYAHHSAAVDDRLMDNMLAVLDYPRATATVKASALEVDGGDRRHLVVCGTEGTMHIQPLDNPSARLTLSKSRGRYREGYQDISFPKYFRYEGDAADMAQIIRQVKQAGFSAQHDLAVQAALLQACGLPPESDATPPAN
jgi:predicted dehydrogenase